MNGSLLVALLLAAAAGALLPAGRGPADRVARDPAAARRARPAAAGPGWPPRRWRRLVGQRATREVRSQLAELLVALAAELRGGADARVAVRAAAEGLPRLAGVARAASSPVGDVAAALRGLAGLPGGRTAGDLAVAWEVAERTGCALAEPVARLHAAHRWEERLHRELAAQLAGPRATAHLLAVLPVVGVVLGTGLGADPVTFLLGTPVGRVCLGAGALLAALGVLWTGRIVAAVAPDVPR